MVWVCKDSRGCNDNMTVLGRQALEWLGVFTFTLRFVENNLGKAQTCFKSRASGWPYIPGHKISGAMVFVCSLYL
jgi:hypothetical protein